MTNRKEPTQKERGAALLEAGYRCANPVCRTTIVLDVHHIIEVCTGGGNDPSNLLAVCPTCHALYHRGTIPRDAIQSWKARLIALNKAGIDTQSFFPTSSYDRKGFALGFAEFTWRTCEIGLREERRFKKAGLCTFVSSSTAVTTAELVNSIMSHSPEFGVPAISTRAGMAPFTLKKIDEDLAVVEMGAIDDADVKELTEGKPMMRALMGPPLQTPVRYRILPIVGEAVGLLHGPKTTKKLRGTMDFQFEQSVVSYMNNGRNTGKHFQFTLGALATRVHDDGAPVFTIDGRMLGMVADVGTYEDETGWRPIIANLLGLRDFLPDEAAS